MPKSPRKPAKKLDPATMGMGDLLDSLPSLVESKPRAGTFRILNQRLLIVRPEVIVDLQKQLEQSLGLSSKGFIYLAGEKSAKEGHNLLEGFSDGQEGELGPLDALNRVADSMALLGWGRLEVTTTDAAAQRYMLTLENSPIAEAYGPSKKPVCHILAGWLAGVADNILGRNLLCEEVACRSQGKPRCEFELRPMPYP